mmetsp:Transcript_17435/g.60881  ORF Transcript_17435/g.60881 Transcript_17435/m.60881 type:complete len:210 (-) Transcript_17435:361-990(-)
MRRLEAALIEAAVLHGCALGSQQRIVLHAVRGRPYQMPVDLVRHRWRARLAVVRGHTAGEVCEAPSSAAPLAHLVRRNVRFAPLQIPSAAPGAVGSIRPRADSSESSIVASASARLLDDFVVEPTSCVPVVPPPHRQRALLRVNNHCRYGEQNLRQQDYHEKTQQVKVHHEAAAELSQIIQIASQRELWALLDEVIVAHIALLFHDIIQ